MTIFWIIYPLCSIFVIMGFVGAVYSLKGIQRSHVTRRWPSVEAEVTHCGGETLDDEEQAIGVHYTYIVNGETYASTAIRPYCQIGVKESVPLIEKLKGRKAVVAQYNPSNPEESCLVSGSFKGDWAMFCGALLFLCAGVLLMLACHFLWSGTADYASALTILEEPLMKDEAR